MPSPTQGFSGSEIVSRIQNYVGNTSSEFKTYVEQSLPLAEYRFYKLHDWSFLRKAGLSLTLQANTAEYNLDSATVGYELSTGDIESIYFEADGVVLRKVDLPYLRRLDPESDDGSSSDTPTLWASVSDRRIRIWPPSTKTGTLKIDAKISTPQLTTLTNYPLIPYKYQESFIAYLIAMALDRENDDRARSKKQEALALIRLDIQDDMRNLGDVHNARLKHWREARLDGVGANLEATLFGLIDCD